MTATSRRPLVPIAIAAAQGVRRVEIQVTAPAG
jgi:hypothetical protein